MHLTGALQSSNICLELALLLLLSRKGEDSIESALGAALDTLICCIRRWPLPSLVGLILRSPAIAAPTGRLQMTVFFVVAVNVAAVVV